MENNQSRGGTIILSRGSLYLSAALYEQYFEGLDAVILLRREGDFYILPVRNTSGGGYLLKLRNSAGDRIIIAPDFFRTHDLDDFHKREIRFVWDKDMAGLRAACFFKTAK